MVRIFRGGTLDERFEGSVVVIGPRSAVMNGLVRGDLFVRDGAVCEVTGMVTGSLIAERASRAILKGMVVKDAKASGGEMEIYGFVQGNVINEGGKIYVDVGSVVKGKIMGSTESVLPRTAASSPQTGSQSVEPPN